MAITGSPTHKSNNTLSHSDRTALIAVGCACAVVVAVTMLYCLTPKHRRPRLFSRLRSRDTRSPYGDSEQAFATNVTPALPPDTPHEPRLDTWDATSTFAPPGLCIQPCPQTSQYRAVDSAVDVCSTKYSSTISLKKEPIQPPAPNWRLSRYFGAAWRSSHQSLDFEKVQGPVSQSVSYDVDASAQHTERTDANEKGTWGSPLQDIFMRAQSVDNVEVKASMTRTPVISKLRSFFTFSTTTHTRSSSTAIGAPHLSPRTRQRIEDKYQSIRSPEIPAAPVSQEVIIIPRRPSTRDFSQPILTTRSNDQYFYARPLPNSYTHGNSNAIVPAILPSTTYDRGVKTAPTATPTPPPLPTRCPSRPASHSALQPNSTSSRPSRHSRSSVTVAPHTSPIRSASSGPSPTSRRTSSTHPDDMSRRGRSRSSSFGSRMSRDQDIPPVPKLTLKRGSAFAPFKANFDAVDEAALPTAQRAPELGPRGGGRRESEMSVFTRHPGDRVLSV